MSKQHELKADNHFALFGLPVRQQLDTEALEKTWHELAVRLHPDRHATASPAEKRVVMQWAAAINQAWQTLRLPLARARYLCELAGQPLDESSNTRVSPEFLMQQMAWREQLDEARRMSANNACIQALRDEVQRCADQLQTQVAHLIDERHDMAQAAQCVREWMFVDKLLQEIQAGDDSILEASTRGPTANL